MPSPFPGMDPYLENPDIWPDFHDAFASEIRRELNRLLPQPYYARLEMRPELGIVEDEGPPRRIIPDVVAEHHGPTAATAVAIPPRSEISPSVAFTVHGELLRHHFVEIRDPAQDHRLVTLIEIASPSNKRPGPDRRAYARKQSEILRSDANLVEIDLLRSGDRFFAYPELEGLVSKLPSSLDYLVLVNRSWKRVDTALDFQVFPIGIRDSLPCIPIPLKEGEAEIPLDLQYLMNLAYDGGPYRRGAIDYRHPPQPSLPAELAGWAKEKIQPVTW